MLRSTRLTPRLERLGDRIAPATFTVTNANNAGTGSLRQAVLDANAASGADLIDFSTFFDVPRTIALVSQISITGPVTIDGTSAANVIVSGNDAVGIFSCVPAPAGTAIGFVDLTLRAGRADRGGAILATVQSLTVARCAFANNVATSGGGAIASGSSLTVTDSVFTSNIATFGGGGAIAASGATTLTRCAISGNQAFMGGGGLTSNGSLFVEDSTFSTNTAISDTTPFNFQPSYGGAISSGGPTVLTRCEIATNVAAFAGGLSVSGNLLLEASSVSGNLARGTFDSPGYYYPGNGGGVVAVGGVSTIRNSTISSNSASGAAGISSDGTIVVQNSTISGNAAYLFDGPSGSLSGVTVSLESSIVANNTAVNGNPDITATTVNARTSSIFDRSGYIGIGTFNDLGGNRPAGEDPHLGPLQNNGGPTRTHLLLPGSPCLNAGSNPANLTTDQRGYSRVLNGTIDMGAAEVADINPTATATSFPATITAAGGTSFTVVVRYNDDIGIDPATLDLSDITVAGPGYAAPQTPTARTVVGSGTVVTVTYTLPAPGGSFDFTDGGLYAIAMVANQVGDTDIPAQHFVPAGPLGTFRVAIAGTIEVDEPSDIDDGNITAGHVSLREAVRLSNAAEGTADTITFSPTVFGTPRTVTLNGTPLAVNDSLAIVGPGAGLLTLNSAGLTQVISINTPALATSLSGLTVTNDFGRGFFAYAQLSLSGVVVTNCHGTGVAGGFHVVGALTMRDCLVSNNRTTGGPGGGLFVFGGPVAIERSVITNNEASESGGGLNFNSFSYFALLQISDSTISGNRSNLQSTVAGGGGIYLRGSVVPGSFIRNSTISGNTAAQGAGLALRGYGNNLPIANSTITGNSATGSGGGIARIVNYIDELVTVSLSSTIVAGNSAGTGADIFSTPPYPFNVSGNDNLIGVANSGGFTLTGTGNLTGTVAAPLNPMLGPLADNGGPTRTHALLPGSPALNAGNNAAGLTTDQRGGGFVRVVGSAADIGAFEAQPSAPRVQGFAVNGGAAQRSRVTTLSVTFTAQVTFAGAVADAFTLSRIGGGPVGSFTATAAVVNGVTVVTLSGFAGAETEFGSLADGRYALTVRASQVLGLDGNGDGVSGDDYALAGSAANGLYRLFGDGNGDGTVNAFDFAQFRGAFGSSLGQPAYVGWLDLDGDGVINAFDFSQFRNRFGAGVP